LGIKPHLFRIFSGFMALWSFNHLVYQVLAWTVAAPVAAPERLLLVFPGQEPGYALSLFFHGLGVVVFGIVAITPGRAIMRVEEWWLAHRERPSWVAGVFLYLGLALFILLSFWLSISEPRYRTYLDREGESVVRRHTHLVRPGVVHQIIPFGEIQAINFESEYSVGRQDHYLKLVTQEGREIEVGRFVSEFSPLALADLGKELSEYAAVPFAEPDLSLFPDSDLLTPDNR
jgi:hypothetical protein